MTETSAPARAAERGRTPAGTPAGPAARRLAVLAAVAAGYAYLLIVFGGIVRITGSGMGCGDDWPLCRGELVPPFDLPTLIEYGHRLLAALAVLPFGAVGVHAWRHRREAGIGGPGGAARPVALALALFPVQALLGALTVRLALPAGVSAAHFVIATILLAALVVAAVRAAGWGAPDPGPAAAGGRGAAVAAAALGLGVLALGALTANAGAGPACQGFPLCNGELFPAPAPLVHLHWSHRMLAFLLVLHLAATAPRLGRRGAPRAARRAARAALGLALLQLGVAAALVLAGLPRALQALHLAVGVAVWAALVAWAALARRAAPSLDAAAAAS